MIKTNSTTDYFDEDASELCSKKLFLFDMDGTIYEEDRLFDGTLDLLNYIKNNNGHYVFITNNSSKSTLDYIEKLNRFGIEATQENFFTSTKASILYLKNKKPNSLVYAQGTCSFLKELRDAGLNVTDEVDRSAEIVLVGFDTELTSEKLRNTCEMLQGDMLFLATNPDLKCPASFGFIPDCGSICQMLENATGKKPVFLGKPEPIMVEIVCKNFAISKKEAVVIGDRLYTDIATGINAGVTTVCVLTGEATEEDIYKGEIKPTYTFKTMRDIAETLKSNINKKYPDTIL